MSDVMIEAQGLTKRYGNFTALSDVSFEVRKGEVLGFLGPNGAGKSTTMKILTCFIAPTEGTAKVSGCDIFEDPMGVRSAIGYLPETTPLYPEMMVLEYLEWVASMRGFDRSSARPRIKRVVEETGLGEKIGNEIRELSKGYRQRVGLAQAMLHEPPVLILDEPMTGLDPNQAVEIRNLIKEIGKQRTVILSTHNLAEVQVACNRVLIVSRGKLVADDKPEKLLERGGRPRIELTLLVNEKDPVTQLGKVAGVDRVIAHEPVDGEQRFEVIYGGDQDVRPELFKAAAEGGLVMVGMRELAQNLEGIFRDLTTDAQGSVAPPAQDSSTDNESAKEAS